MGLFTRLVKPKDETNIQMNMVKNPNWQEEDQTLNLLKSGTLTTQPCCLINIIFI